MAADRPATQDLDLTDDLMDRPLIELNGEGEGDDEGEADNIEPMDDDSSEEEEDNPEDLRKVAQGFIVDEDEEEDEEEEDREENLKRSKKHRKRKRRHGVSLVSVSRLILCSRLNPLLRLLYIFRG
jgi:hypothetical protein